MEIREAILKAAHHIGSSPHCFDFCHAVTSPGTLEEPGCFIGWIAFFSGEEAGQPCGSSAFDRPLPRKLLGVSFEEFYRRMRALGRAEFSENPQLAASTLRLYADHYHPAPIKVPDWEALSAIDVPAMARELAVG